IAPPASGSGASSDSMTKKSGLKSSTVVSGIHLFLISDVLERLHPDTPVSIQEPFALRALLEIEIHHSLHSVGDFMGGEARAHDLADAGVFRTRAAQQELVIFHAFLIDTQNADMAGVMMAAGIDAAGNLEFELADIMLASEISEALGDVLRHGNRTGV